MLNHYSAVFISAFLIPDDTGSMNILTNNLTFQKMRLGTRKERPIHEVDCVN